MTIYIDKGYQDLHLTKKTLLKVLSSSFYEHFSDFSVISLLCSDFMKIIPVVKKKLIRQKTVDKIKVPANIPNRHIPYLTKRAFILSDQERYFKFVSSKNLMKNKAIFSQIIMQLKKALNDN